MDPRADAAYDLRAAVRDLVRPQSRRIPRDQEDGTTAFEWVSVHSLLAELQLSISSSGEQGGAGRGGSRVPIDLDALDLLDRIRVTVSDWTGLAGLTSRGKLAADLDQLAGHTFGDVQEAEQLARIIRGYVGSARGLLSGEVAHRDIRGVPCLECGYQLWDENTYGETVRVPNLRVDLQEGQVRAIWCRACWATWWRGEQLAALYEALVEEGVVDPLADVA